MSHFYKSSHHSFILCEGGRICWVTAAFDSKECLKALVLAESLKKARTSADTTVLVGPEVPVEIS
jgi:hypothetical protein